MALNVYSFDVFTASHADLQRGETATGHVRVVVAAETILEASLIAAQMVLCHFEHVTEIGARI